MNSASSAENAENRSLKSGFVAMLASEGSLLLDHFPRGREDPFRADLLPEVEVEGAVIALTVAEDTGHDDGPGIHGRESYHAGVWHWFQVRRRATLGGP
jgi:hypothetical protein